MSFLYEYITCKSPEISQYNVSFKGNNLGIIIKQGNVWLVARPGSNSYESEIFSDKQEAAKHLTNLAEINWQQ